MSMPLACRPSMLLLLLLTACEGGQAPLLGEEKADPPRSDSGEPDSGAPPIPPSDEGPENLPSANALWLRAELESPGSITFNELLYHHPTDRGQEWIELHNPMALDMDLSGWLIEGGVDYTFPEGTLIPAGGYLVVAADPAAISGAIGPYTGELSHEGERLTLRNATGRRIDSVYYAEDDPWPVAADGSGHSLAKIDPDTATDRAEHWAGSAEAGGTPNADNGIDPTRPATTLELVPLDATWAFDDRGAYPASDWASPTYDDSGWARGAALFYAGEGREAVDATVWASADNYYGLYLGAADGSDLRQIGEDADGDWTTAESFEATLSPTDHLYIAAWELTGDWGSPQMTLAEVDLGDEIIGTSSTAFEWVLGPAGDNPGATPPSPPPGEAALAALIADANAAGDWDAPAVEAAVSSDPWGWALAGTFDSDTAFIWGDTFDGSSVTNTDDTYALFRSAAPILGGDGTTELSAIPTTALFRTAFTLDADPTTATLRLRCQIDDGAIVYLNGVEALRLNLPAGPIDADTLAAAEIDSAEETLLELPASALVRGENLLAVELHQAGAPDADLRFGCALSATVRAVASSPALALQEVSAAGDAPWVELIGLGDGGADTEGLILRNHEGAEQRLSAGALDEGQLALIEPLDLALRANEPLFLFDTDGRTLIDAVRVHDQPRARLGEGGPWRRPTEATPGEPNAIELVTDVVINELMYHAPPVSAAGEPFAARAEEWIELYNRGEQTVDLSGWQLVDAVAFTFPAGTELAPGAFLVVARDPTALLALHPEATVLGPYAGGLSNRSDHLLLRDARANPADALRYFDGGRWPSEADGGGASLELRDARADNAHADAWAASDEGARTTWETYRIRGTAEASAVGPDGLWEELVLGLLDEGVVLVDDLSVVADPDGTATELLANGGFDRGEADWRILGNHRHSAIVTDPDDAGNAVLRLEATGPTGHMHNHIETTLAAPVLRQEYEVSFRARWVSGSNQLHARLYFNRLPATTLLTQPDRFGTPGTVNSRATEALGPTFGALRQDVVVPAAGEPVTLSIAVDDPDGLAEVLLYSGVAGEALSAQPMTETEDGRWEGQIAGQPAGTLLQFYVEARDTRGDTSAFPAAGAASSALLRVDDGEAATSGLHNLRILLTPDASDWLHDDINLMSDDPVGATVIYDERTVFYDVGVRAKGSQRGRPEVARLGYAVSFGSDQLFRGSHSSVHLDRSEGVISGQREMLINLVMARAGSVSVEYNDLVQAITPLSVHTGPAELQLDRFSGLVLDAQFEEGSEGALYEYELIYYPYTTDDGTRTGYKLPQPDSVVGTSITDLGADKEAYRWNFMLQNNERQDNYDPMIGLAQTFGASASDLRAQAPAVIDVDQWLRAYAFATFSGAVDNYGSDGSQHNARFYQRPEDGRMLYFPHDLDFFGGSTMPVIGNSDLAKLLVEPLWRRAYYSHLEQILSRIDDGLYLAPACSRMELLLPRQNVASDCQFVLDRAAWLRDGAPDALTRRFPVVEFAITTGDGADFTTDSTTVLLEGAGWLDVRQLFVNGVETPFDWTDADSWQATLTLAEGLNALDVRAGDGYGTEVGAASIGITVELAE